MVLFSSRVEQSETRLTARSRRFFGWTPEAVLFSCGSGCAMPTVDVAHVSQSNRQMVIVFMSTDYGIRPRAMQDKMLRLLKLKATEAGMTGQVVPVWKDGKTMRGIAPPEWKGFFNSITWDDAVSKVSTTLTW
jgi:hypothetical protein